MKYGIVIDHPYGPLSMIGEYSDLDRAIEAAENRDRDETPTDLEDEVGYDPDDDPVYDGLVEAVEEAGWERVYTDTDRGITVYVAP